MEVSVCLLISGFISSVLYGRCVIWFAIVVLLTCVLIDHYRLLLPKVIPLVRRSRLLSRSRKGKNSMAHDKKN